MSFLWPSLLVCIGLVPLIVFAYLWGLKRRPRYTVRMSSLSLVREAARGQSLWRRHLPFGFFLLALTSVFVAMCRPVIKVNVPAKQGTMVLALDVSRSMCSPDIGPTRLQALETTLIHFIANQSAATKIGVVAFSDFAEIIQPPSNDKEAVDQAVKSLMTGWKRAIGDGIYESVDAIGKEEGLARDGRYAPAVIILVTNGINNAGLSPLDAARLAAERGIRIYTVGLSSPSGPLDASCQSSDPSGFGGESQNLITGRMGPDVDALEQIASLTGAKYFPASGLSGLKTVFKEEQLQTILVSKNLEITVAFVVLGMLFAVISFCMAFIWGPLL